MSPNPAIDRWSYLSSSSGLLELLPVEPRALRRFPLFKNVEYEHLHLASEDMALAKWQGGVTLFGEGDFVDMAFLVVSGNVKLMTNVQTQPERANAGVLSFQSTWGRDESSGVMKMRLGPNDVFGEIGVVNGWPQPFAAVTEGECVLLQIRMPALRRLRSKIKTLDELLGKEYARQIVLWMLKQHALFQDVHEAMLAELAATCEFRHYEPGETLVQEHDPADALYLLRAGFVRLSRVLVEEPVTINYLEPGEAFGAHEFLQTRNSSFAHTLTSYDFSDVLRIPFAALHELTQYDFRISMRLHECARVLLAKTTFDEQPDPASTAAFAPTLFLETTKLSTNALPDPERLALLESIMAQGLMQGQNTMLIDLARCTHCNDCVSACAETHDGLPRFVREGERVGNWLVANSCRHCRDPLCLIGCPTGAITRRGANAIVEIDESLCIGCKACALHCPFDAIMMHDTGELWQAGNAPQANLISKAKLVASKCDACAGKNHGPACVMACPVGCLVRVGNVKEFLESVG